MAMLFFAVVVFYLGARARLRDIRAHQQNS